MNSSVIMLIEFHKRICGILLDLYRVRDICNDGRQYLEYYSKVDIRELIDNLADIKEKVYDIISSLSDSISLTHTNNDLYWQGYQQALSDLKKSVDKI